MNLFPEREDWGGRRLLVIALVLSLLVHAGGAGVARWWWPSIARAVAKVLPQPTPSPEIVALSDAITIEKRTVPRPSRRNPQQQPHRAQPQRRPQPRTVARLPAVEKIIVPTLAPIPTQAPTVAPTVQPTSEPTLRPRHGTIHRVVAVAPRARPTVEPTPAPQTAQQSEKTAFQQKLARYQSQWSRTIAQAQRSLYQVPPQRRPPARMPDQPQYPHIMDGTPEKFLTAQGTCDPLEAYWHEPVVFRYLRCDITYSDGHFEEVSLPWPFRFTRRSDPFDPSRGRIVFPMQAPPDGFVLPAHFALSRAVCSFFRDRCQRVLDAERANGGQPATSP